MAEIASHPAPALSEKAPAESTPAATVPAAEGEAKPAETASPAVAMVGAPVITDAVPPVTAPTVESKAESKDFAPADPTGPVWPSLEENHPINKLNDLLPGLIKEAGYDEVYGLKLEGNEFHKKLILQKFLRANANDIEKAKEQLFGTLKWRKEFNALASKDEVFSKSRFGGLGYITTVSGVPESPNAKDIVTFNIYGAVKDNKATFGNVEDFLRWRVALMELGIAKLELANATKPIPDYGQGPDPYQGIQIHDYLSVSFLRQDPLVKAASKQAIETFQKFYPETLSRKFFVNVPVVMGWVFTAIKLVLPKATVKKFTVLSYGKDLAGELGPDVPEIYGGKSGDLATVGESLKENDDGPAATTAPPDVAKPAESAEAAKTTGTVEAAKPTESVAPAASTVPTETTATA